MKRALFIISLLLGIITFSLAQPCTELGQTPQTAFPVCGTSVFQQSSVPICSSVSLYVPGCSASGAANYENKNPFWYQFYCYQSGTLGFVITPNNMGDDYDWQLYDITNKNPVDVLTDRTIIVTGNWSGSYGLTGASSSGVNYIECASAPSDNKPTFSAMPMLIQGHTYILLVSHFTDSQSGYGLSFQGGTAVITDTTQPHMLTADAACDGTVIRLRLNKNMKCSSLSRNGSEFQLAPFAGTILSAVATSCTGGFDMDEIEINLSAPLNPGNYTLTIRNGIDGNTLLDNCDKPITSGESLNIVMYPFLPTPMDSVTVPGCSPQNIELIFRKGIRCNSISSTGSEFSITGPSPVSISGVSLDCDSGLTNKITLNLSQPIQLGGTYFVSIHTGTDGNTVEDECGQITPDTTLEFIVKDTVNADFTYQINYSCNNNSVNYFHDGRNGVNSWNWTFLAAGTSLQQNPVKQYPIINSTNTSLIVSNGVCSDTSRVDISFNNYLKAAFETEEFVCPNDQLTIQNNTEGNAVTWQWDFGNGATSSLQDPLPQSYQVRDISYDVTVRLIAINAYGCADTAFRRVKVINNCFIAVPSAFTPNNDGLNDNLYPLNAYKARDLKFSVFNRFGQRVFYTEDWTKKWDGRHKGQPADGGTYVWMLFYTESDTGKKIAQKGTSILIR